MSTTPPTGAAKRKRTSARESTPAGWGHMEVDSIHDSREDDKNRQIRYTLAGQINATPMSPAVGAENGLLEDSVYSDVDYRKRLCPTEVPNEPESQSDQPYDAGNADEPQPTAGWSIFNPLGTIGDMVGKVWEFCKTGAFRGFHAGGGNGYTFNGTTITETKSAGGGQGHPWGNEHEIPSLASENQTMTQGLSDPFQSQVTSPFTNDYPDDYDSPDSTPQPAAKRRQISANKDELRNWVVVDEPESQPSTPETFSAGVKAATASRPHPPARARSTFYANSGRRITAPSARFTGGTPRASGAARSSLRISQPISPRASTFTPPREPASFASPRQAPPVLGTPSRIPLPVQLSNHNPFTNQPPDTLASPTPSSPSAAAGIMPGSASRPSSRLAPRRSIGSLPSGVARPSSPTKISGTHRRNQSGTSASSRRHSLLASSVVLDPDNAVQASPRLSAEAKQLAHRKLTAEKETDAKVDAFNARLMAMIRQGKEALGTRVEVEMDDEFDAGRGAGGGGVGGGWEDDDDSYL